MWGVRIKADQEILLLLLSYNWRSHKLHLVCRCVVNGGTLYSVDPGTGDQRIQDPGNQGPKLASTVCMYVW